MENYANGWNIIFFFLSIINTTKFLDKLLVLTKSVLSQLHAMVLVVHLNG